VRRSWIICLLAVIAVLGASAAALAAEAGGGPDPAISNWPNWPGRVSCGQLSFKPLVAFARPTDAENERKPSAAALRRVLAEGLYREFGAPKHGWRLLAETSNVAEFAAGRLGRDVQVIPVERKGRRWKQVGYSGGCVPAVLRKGRTAITWTLASDQELRPSTRTIEVNLGPGECDSGLPQAERLERPSFREENGALLMALWLRPYRHDATCQGTFEPPVKIRLPRRLGHHELLDGGVFPPISSAEEIRREEGF
jgi:hypothetical protein